MTFNKLMIRFKGRVVLFPENIEMIQRHSKVEIKMDKNDVQFLTYIKTNLMFIIKKGGVKPSTRELNFKRSGVRKAPSSIADSFRVTETVKTHTAETTESKA